MVSWTWLAGFFDGEGNIAYRDAPTMKARRIAVIQLSQKEPNVLEIIKQFLISEGMRPHIYYNKNKWGGAYLLKLERPIDVLSFLERISSLLFSRKAIEASEAIEFIRPIAVNSKVYKVKALA